jgi:hypothetical protein
MKKIKQLAVQIFCTYAGWLAICMILVVIFGLFSPWSAWIEPGYVWCGVAMWISLAYPLALSIIMIGYAIRNTFFKKWRDKP